MMFVLRAGIDGIGNVHAVELISRFGKSLTRIYLCFKFIDVPPIFTLIASSGSVENLLQSVDEIKEGKIKEVSEVVLHKQASASVICKA